MDEGGPVLAPADLSLTKLGPPVPVLVGEELTYNLTVTNNGPSLATGVVLTDTLPPNVTFDSAVPSQGTCDEAQGTVTCDLGGILNLATVTITIIVTPEEAEEGTTGGTIITNTASVEATEDDSDDSNNTAAQGTVVNRQADTSVVKMAAPDPVLVAQPLTYTLVVNNHGPSQATMIVVTDDLPDNVTFETAETSQGSCKHADGIVTCDLGNLDSGTTATVVIIVFPGVAAGGTTVTNTATVTSDVDDFNPGNATDGRPPKRRSFREYDRCPRPCGCGGHTDLPRDCHQ